MIVNRIEPGRYEARQGRGQNRRTFEIVEVPRDNEDGYLPGWLVLETGIHFLTIENGYSVIAHGLPTKKAAVAAAEAEL